MLILAQSINLGCYLVLSSYCSAGCTS